MTEKYKISIAKRILLLALGLHVAFFAASPKEQEFSDQPRSGYVDNGMEEEGSERESEEFLVAYQAIVPIIQFHIDHELIFVLDFFILDEEKFESKPESRQVLCNYFKVLFCQIISPNAP